MEGGFLPDADPVPRPRRGQFAAQLDPPSLQQQQLTREREQQISASTSTTSTSTRCARCGVASGDPWTQAFGACSRCVGGGSNASLISKKTAKELYLLTDGDLAALGSVPRANPHGRTLAPMRLYLESQVRAVAAERHGGGVSGVGETARNGGEDDEEDDVEYRASDDDEFGGGGFIPAEAGATEKSGRSLDARLERARLARVEKRLSDRAARRAAESAKEASAAAKLARARAAVEERCSRLEVDEVQRVVKKVKEKKKRKKKSSDSDDKSDDDVGVEVETI